MAVAVLLVKMLLFQEQLQVPLVFVLDRLSLDHLIRLVLMVLVVILMDGLLEVEVVKATLPLLVDLGMEVLLFLEDHTLVVVKEKERNRVTAMEPPILVVVEEHIVAVQEDLVGRVL